MNPNKSKFHLLEPIVVQDYITRVLALFYIIIRRKEYLIDASDISLERFENFNTIISALSYATYFQLVDDIRRTAFILNIWKDLDSKDKPIKNIEFRSIYQIF